MVAVNPDLHANGYQHSPTHRVRGVFKDSNTLNFVVESLLSAGFSSEEIELFVGEEGVRVLDSSAKHQGVVTRLLRDLESTFFANDTEYHAKVDSLLEWGGCAVDVMTGGDQQKKTIAAQIMKAGNAEDVVYWGHLVVEWL